MKLKALKIIIGVICLILISITLIIIYYLNVDIETKVPKQLEETCKLETQYFMQRKIFILTPKNTQKTDLKILYFHGGSYVAEATQKHWKFLEKIVQDTGATIILPDYPLTPKYTYKDVFKMIVPLYKEIIEEIDTNNIILMGDSAGGGMGLALLEKLVEENIAQPRKTILISPWLDVKLENPDIEKLEPYDTQLNKETLKLAGIAYASEDGKDSYLVNPINGDLSKIKNVTIFTGTYDILYADVKKLQEKAINEGNSIEVKEYEKAQHIWIIEKNSETNLVEKGYQDLINCIDADNY